VFQHEMVKPQRLKSPIYLTFINWGSTCNQCNQLLIVHEIGSCLTLHALNGDALYYLSIPHTDQGGREKTTVLWKGRKKWGKVWKL